jgi:hypothetical protein
MSDGYQAITQTVQTYFDGLHEGDTAKLGSVFHPASHLFANVEGELLDWSREHWFEVVNGRESAASQGLPRHDRIVSIDMSDDNTAIVTCECAIPPRYFTDFLTLIKIGGKWQIVSKSFRFDTHE